jgi:acetolactate synthase I/II/III large subunit
VVSKPSLAVEHNIASYAVDLVTALGPDTVFSLTGGMAMYLNRAVAAHPTLQAVYCQHEQACVAAAEGYAKASDFRKPGFAVITAGPGVSNAVTSLVSAYGDSTPLIALAGQIKTEDIDPYGTRTHGIQEVRSREIVTPCVKRFERLSIDNFRETLVDAISEGLSGRPGPVFIEIPLDVQGRRVAYSDRDIAADAAKIHQIVESVSIFGQQKMTEALEALLDAKRPLLYIGNGCRIANVEQCAVDLIRRFGMPAIFSWLSFDILPATDRLYFGCPGGLAPISANEILSAADVIVFLGARLDLGTTAFQRRDFGSQASRFFVDIDARELSKFEGYANAVLVQADLHCLPRATAQLNVQTSAASADWLPWCESRREKYLAEERRQLSSGEMNVYNLTQRISKWTEGMVVVPASSGYAEETFSRFFQPGTGTRFFNGAALGAMGLCLPHAIGASFGSPRRVICLDADGGIMLNLQELATLSHYAPKGFVIFLLNNHGYESIRASQTRHFGMEAGVDQNSGVFLPDFAKVANAFGIRYQAVRSLSDLEQLLPELGEEASPILVDMHIPNFEPRGPGVRTVMGPDGKPSTTPLAEIAW